jgi:hypothetical protein
VQLQIAVALLGMGEASEASAILSALADRAFMRNSALQHLVVAHALAGRSAEAAAALRDWRGECNRPHPRNSQPAQSDPVVELATLWLRGLLGAAMSGQADARQAGADPSLTVLQPMLRDAIRTFDAALRHDERILDPAERADLERQRGICLAAMGATSVPGYTEHTLEVPCPAESPAAADVRRAA